MKTFLFLIFYIENKTKDKYLRDSQNIISNRYINT